LSSHQKPATKMKLKLRDYYQNHLFNISWPVFALVVLLFLANIAFYIFYLHEFSLMKNLVAFFDGYVSPGIVNNIYSIFIFYILFNYFRAPNAKFSLFRNNLVSAIIILCLSGAAFFIVSPFYEKEDLLFVPGGVDYIDLFLSAVFEELFFRYFMLGMFFSLFKGFPVLKRLWLSILGTTAVFVIAHFFSTYQNGTINILNYVSLALFAIGTSWIYIKYSNIMLVIYVHFIGNFILNFVPLKTAGYSAGMLFLLFVLVLLAGRGNHIKHWLRVALTESRKQVDVGKRQIQVSINHIKQTVSRRDSV
jgi:membrane protease YdiL (CAAX protease family)